MIKRYRRTVVSQYVVVGLVLISLIILGFLSAYLMSAVPFVDHFAIPWAAGRAWLLEGENPYDPGMAQIAEEAIADAGYLGQLPEQEVLLQPLVNLFFFLPFSLIPYPISRTIWVVVLVVSAGFFVNLSIKFSDWKLSIAEKIGIILLLILWFPGIYAVLTGRLSLILIFLMLTGLYFLKAGNYQAAGFILALTAVSMPLSILIIILAILWSISKKHWSFIVAYFSGFAFLMIVSLLMLSSWPLDWLRTVLEIYPDFTWIQTPIMTLASVLPGIANFLSIALHAGFGFYLLVVWINLFISADRVLPWSVLVVLVIAYFFIIQDSFSALYLVVPALIMVFRFASDRWRLIGRIGAWLLLILVSAGSWLIVIPEVRFTDLVSAPALMVSLPLFTFFGMIWIRWWAVKLTRLPGF